MITHMAEAVGRGHLDKVADTLSDLLVDKIVSQDPLAYVAIDACVGRGCVVLSGCVRGRQACDMAGLQVFVQEWLPCQGLGCDLQIIWNIREEKGPPSFSSPQQAMCVGYATAETPQLMPFSHQIAQLFAQGIGAVTGIGPYLKLMVLADDTMGSCRVFVRAQGSEADRPALEADILRVCEHILLRQKSTQKVSLTCIFDKMPFAERLASSQGLTGRKTTQDAYGPTVPFTGGAFSGKSAHHLDRSGNYMARYVAKNIVSQGIAHTCLVELAYTESSVMPLQRQVTLDGRVLGAGACAALLGAYEPLMTLEACVAFFGLTRLSMAPFSCFGHFGTTAAAPWECLNSADFDQHEISHHV